MLYLIKHVWPRGLRRCAKVAFSSEAQVRILSHAHGAVAQLEECPLCKREVAGSKPASSKNTCIMSSYTSINIDNTKHVRTPFYVWVFGDKECWGVYSPNKPPDAIIKQNRMKENVSTSEKRQRTITFSGLQISF